MKPQIVLIGGGDAFDNYEDYLNNLKNRELSLERIQFVGWKDNLSSDLGENFDVVYPRMPNIQNARYKEWKIWFERIIPLLNDNIILIGHSLGGIFITKYLSENKFPKKLIAVFLVAAPYNTPVHHPLVDFVINTPLDNFQNQVEEIFLFHSKDDKVVPFENLERLHKDLPKANVEIFQDKGHFNEEHFPELVEEIKKCV